MAEAGDEFAVVKLPHGIQSRPSAERAVVLGLLRHDVQHEPQAVHVREDDLPLVELGAVVTVPHIGGGPHPGVAAVAAIQVVGEEVDAVHPLRREVIQRADHSLPFAALPRRVACAPVLHVRLVLVDEGADLFIAARIGVGIARLIEIRVRQKVLRAIRAALEVILAGSRIAQVEPARVLEQALAAEPGHLERAGSTIERGGRPGAGFQADGDIRSRAERSAV